MLAAPASSSDDSGALVEVTSRTLWHRVYRTHTPCFSNVTGARLFAEPCDKRGAVGTGYVCSRRSRTSWWWPVRFLYFMNTTYIAASRALSCLTIVHLGQSHREPSFFFPVFLSETISLPTHLCPASILFLTRVREPRSFLYFFSELNLPTRPAGSAVVRQLVLFPPGCIAGAFLHSTLVLFERAFWDVNSRAT